MYQPSELIEAAHAAAKAATDSIEPIAKAEEYKEDAKDFLAAIMSAIKSECEFKVSEAELERLARSHEKWKEFRIKQYEAKKKAIKANTDAANAALLYDAYKSALSYQKEEFKHLAAA